MRGRSLRDKRACSIRVILTGVGTGLLLYLSLCNLYPIPLLHPVCPEVDMRMFLLSHLILLLAVAIASAPALGNEMCIRDRYSGASASSFRKQDFP